MGDWADVEAEKLLDTPMKATDVAAALRDAYWRGAEEMSAVFDLTRAQVDEMIRLNDDQFKILEQTRSEARRLRALLVDIAGHEQLCLSLSGRPCRCGAASVAEMARRALDRHVK